MVWRSWCNVGAEGVTSQIYIFILRQRRLCEVGIQSERVRTCGGRRTYTGELTGLLVWPADLCLLSKITDLILSFESHVFSVYGSLSELTYFRCFTVICWSYQRTDISVILSNGNKLLSRHHPLFFSFLWNHFLDVILRPYWICYVHSRHTVAC